LKSWLSPRLVVALVLLAASGTCEVARERRPTYLRPGVHLDAYVGNLADGTVTVVDLAKLASVATVSVGPGPACLRAHPSRPEVWGVSVTGGYAWVLDSATDRLTRIPVGQQPVALDFSPDGRRVYVACAGSGTVVAIDCATRQVIARGRAGRRPSDIRAAPNGKWVLVSNRDDATVSLLDSATLAARATLPVAPQPGQIVVLPDSSKALVASAATDLVSVLRLNPPAVLARLAAGGRADALLMKPDGGEVYVLSSETHGLTVIDTWTNEVGDFVMLGADPVGGAVTGDGTLLYTCDSAAARVSVVNLTYRQLLGSASTGQRPVVCGLDPEQKLVLAADEGSDDLAVVAREGPHLVTLIPVGKQPDSLAVKLF
jgi:YVTN family beta-propeller protein